MERMQPKSLIALISDFGQEDPYVGIMKGVISNLSPQSRLVDITHDIPPGDIQKAGISLWMAKPYFPAGTIFLCVVDPGVGTDRKAIILTDKQHVYIGPDNGVFTFGLDSDLEIHELSNPGLQLPPSSSTFHGRDIFAPAAAHAANGVALDQFGDQISGCIQWPKPEMRIESTRIFGEIIYEDRFGNQITSLGKFTRSGKNRYQLDPWLTGSSTTGEVLDLSIERATLLLPSGRFLSWVDTYAEIEEGECGILVGSTGLLEIAAYRKSAQEFTQLSLGDRITLLF